jgi:hypothetical protein
MIYEKILNGHIAFPPYVDPLAKDLIKVSSRVPPVICPLRVRTRHPQRLLTADLSRRLGNLRNGALDIKTHSWFAGVDWGAVSRREITVRRCRSSLRRNVGPMPLACRRPSSRGTRGRAI